MSEPHTIIVHLVEVLADNSGHYVGNGLQFQTRELAEDYARKLAWRWTAVRDWRVVDAPYDGTKTLVSTPNVSQ